MVRRGVWAARPARGSRAREGSQRVTPNVRGRVRWLFAACSRERLALMPIRFGCGACVAVRLRGAFLLVQRLPGNARNRARKVRRDRARKRQRIAAHSRRVLGRESWSIPTGKRRREALRLCLLLRSNMWPRSTCGMRGGRAPRSSDCGACRARRRSTSRPALFRFEDLACHLCAAAELAVDDAAHVPEVRVGAAPGTVAHGRVDGVAEELEV